jgi:NTE family protein
MLIDGGVLNPVPIAPTFSDDTQITIAVNLGGPLESMKTPKDKQESPTKESESFHEKISHYIDDLKQNLQREVEEIDLGVYDIANQAFDAMQSTIARQKLAAYPPDHTIEIARNACGTLEFDRADEIIALGYRKAKECFA